LGEFSGQEGKEGKEDRDFNCELEAKIFMLIMPG